MSAGASAYSRIHIHKLFRPGRPKISRPAFSATQYTILLKVYKVIYKLAAAATTDTRTLENQGQGSRFKVQGSSIKSYKGHDSTQRK